METSNRTRTDDRTAAEKAWDAVEIAYDIAANCRDRGDPAGQITATAKAGAIRKSWVEQYPAAAQARRDAAAAREAEIKASTGYQAALNGRD